MGGPNLEIFKFGMYIMFPIGVMYYFGTNLDNRFSVQDFWPKASQSHRIPYDRDEIEEELERLKAQRLARRARRLEAERLLQERRAEGVEAGSGNGAGNGVANASVVGVGRGAAPSA